MCCVDNIHRETASGDFIFMAGDVPSLIDTVIVHQSESVIRMTRDIQERDTEKEVDLTATTRLSSLLCARSESGSEGDVDFVV